jgi:MFS family permease
VGNRELAQSRGRFPALYIRDFRIFWIGQVISFSGTWMQSIAQGWLVYTLTKSAFYLGVIAAAASVPVLIFTLIGGVCADRFAKKNILLITQALSVVPALLLAILTDLGIITVWEIALVAFFLGMVNAFDIPARQSFFAVMVQKGNLMNAIALNSAAFNGARIIGPVVAGIIIASIGVSACFYLNALSFLAVIIALAMIKKGEETKGLSREILHMWRWQTLRKEGSTLLRELSEGLHFVRTERHVFRIMLIITTFSLFGIPYVTLLPIFAEDILKVGPKGLGFLAGSSGIGALTAALGIAFRGDIEKKGLFMVIASIVFSAALVAFSLSRHYPSSMAMQFIAGWGMVSFLAIGNSVIQLSTPDALRGRVMSVYTLLFLGMAPIGNSIMGFVAEMVGTDRAVLMGGSICLLTSVLLSGHLRLLGR